MAADEEYLFAALARVRALLFRHAESVVRARGLTLGQFEVLEALASHGPLSVGAIREAVFGTKGTIPLVVKNLERAGLVRKDPSSTDGRVSIVSLTDEGRQLAERAYPEVVASIRRDLSCLNPEEKDLLLRLLHRIENAANAAEGGCNE